MSSETHTAIVNATLAIGSLAFVLVVVIGYFTGASLSTMAFKGMLALVGVGLLGWLVLRLMAARGMMSQIRREDETPFASEEE